MRLAPLALAASVRAEVLHVADASPRGNSPATGTFRTSSKRRQMVDAGASGLTKAALPVSQHAQVSCPTPAAHAFSARINDKGVCLQANSIIYVIGFSDLELV